MMTRDGGVLEMDCYSHGFQVTMRKYMIGVKRTHACIHTHEAMGLRLCFSTFAVGYKEGPFQFKVSPLSEHIRLLTTYPSLRLIVVFGFRQGIRH